MEGLDGEIQVDMKELEVAMRNECQYEYRTAEEMKDFEKIKEMLRETLF